jgi:hypothetical protein
MLKFNASAFVEAIETLSTMRAMAISELEREKPRWSPDGVVREDVAKNYIRQFIGAAQDIGSVFALKAAQRLLDQIEGGTVRWKDVPGHVASIHHILKDELSEGQAVIIQKHRVKYWRSPAPLFGQAVSDRFPAAIDDIEEAGNCLATENGTATIYHLMKVVECGLKGLGSEIGIPYAPSWESYIRQITTQLALPHPKKPKKVKQNLTFFKEVLGDLEAVKFSWRNPTMHVERKYSVDEAEEIFKAVHRFMERLARGLSALRPRRGRA